MKTYLEELTDELACDIATEYLRFEETPLTAFIQEICDLEVIRTSRAKEIVFELSPRERDLVRVFDRGLDFDDYSSIAFIALEGALHRVFWDMELSTGEPIVAGPCVNSAQGIYIPRVFCERYGNHESLTDRAHDVDWILTVDRMDPRAAEHEHEVFDAILRDFFVEAGPLTFGVEWHEGELFWVVIDVEF